MVCVVGFGWTREWKRLRPRFINTLVVAQLGAPGYAAFDLAQVCQWKWQEARLAKVDPAPYRTYLKSIASERRPVPAVPPTRKHVILLQMESVDGLVIGARKDGEPLMPFLESLAREHVYFSNVIDNTAGGRTTDGELLVLTSQVPLRRRPAYVSQPLDRIPSLPKAFKAAGYRCWSMHGHVGQFWRRRPAHQGLGYDEALFRDALDAKDLIGWGISDRSVLHQAAQKLATEKGPTLAHVILLTNHHPYQHVREKFGLPYNGIEDDYVQSVRYVDASIAAFFSELETLGLRDNCIVAVYSDHDSAITGMLERYLENVPNRLISDTVPLIITGLPGVGPQRFDTVAGLQDLPVILLEAAGIAVPATFTGHGLGHTGRTVAALHGPLVSTPTGLEEYELPIDSQLLTMMALRQPEALLEP